MGVTNASVLDVAAYILQKSGAMTTWKLQKLCYYSQAWSLAWTGEPLFNEDFEAWDNGPVCPILFNYHRGKFIISREELAGGNPDNLTEDEKETIDIVTSDYGKMEPYQLRELSHSEAPWKLARGDFKNGEHCSNVISKTSMGEYYGGL